MWSPAFGSSSPVTLIRMKMLIYLTLPYQKLKLTILNSAISQRISTVMAMQTYSKPDYRRQREWLYLFDSSVIENRKQNRMDLFPDG